jgi:hypothetical protein
MAMALAGLASVGCSREASAPGVSSPAATPAGTATNSATAAAQLKDACPLLPADRVAQLVPGAAAPARERFPLRCTFSSDKSALGLTFDNGPAEAVAGAESVPGLGAGGYLERLDPNSKGDVYLTVIIGADANGANHNFHVEVSGHDGKDHKEDAITIAQSVLQQLK